MQNSIRKDYLSKENTNCMKFVFAIAIILCHMFAYTPFGEEIGIGVVITAFGYLSVSAFLFFSGYGLTLQYINKGEQIFDGYFKKRILPLYLIQSILIVLYSLFKRIIGYDISLKLIIQSFFFGKTVVQFGWYIQMIMLFYAVFYFCFRRNNVKSGIIKLGISMLLFSLTCAMIELPSTWYESSFSFVFGAVWAWKKEEIDSKMEKFSKYVYTFLMVSVVFLVSFVLGNAGILPIQLKIPFKMISSVCFMACIILAVMKIRVNYKPIEFAGNYYFEIYILQGFIIIFLNDVFIINNVLLRYFLCIGLVFVSAIFVKPAINFINKKCKGF